ncbi:hypothetical protein JT359_09635 [Candidatus Poribacteria bacterium]|nr:hypothetical protein [Candidatus Poribacteria bacterium]
MINKIVKGISLSILVISLCLTPHLIWGADVVLFEEDFENVKLEDSIAEGVKGTNVWSGTGPNGWEIINENPEDLGMPEWRTWAIVKLEWWVQTAEDQERSQFASKEKNGKGMGNGVVSDPDEWDDWTENGDPDSISSWNGHINTPSINIQGAGPNSLVLSLDSSWRPYADQTAEITTSFDGGKEERILLFSSSGEQTLVTIPTLNKNEEVLNDLEQVNESLEIPINNPDGADELVISFGLLTAGNDWWWAFDNVKLVSTAFVATDVQLKDKLTVKWAELKSVK